MEELKDLLEKYKDKSILYVEDEGVIREQTRRVVSRLFLDVVSVGNGIEALNEYEKRNFDIVMTDIQMPNMDGVALIRNILERSPSQSIVVTTAFNQGDEVEELKKLGVTTIVAKPVSLQDLFSALLSVFDGK